MDTFILIADFKIIPIVSKHPIPFLPVIRTCQELRILSS